MAESPQPSFGPAFLAEAVQTIRNSSVPKEDGRAPLHVSRPLHHIEQLRILMNALLSRDLAIDLDEIVSAQKDTLGEAFLTLSREIRTRIGGQADDEEAIPVGAGNRKSKREMVESLITREHLRLGNSERFVAKRRTGKANKEFDGEEVQESSNPDQDRFWWVKNGEPLSPEDYARDERLHGLSRRALLIEYISARLSREKDELAGTLYRQNKMGFAGSGSGHEAVFLAVERWLGRSDFESHYYRSGAGELQRAGLVFHQLLLDLGRGRDPHTGGRDLVGHVGDPTRNILPVTTYLPAHLPVAVGIGRAIAQQLRQEEKQRAEGKEIKERPVGSPISVMHIGDGGLGEGEAREAVDEALLGGGSPCLFVVHNNGVAISTGPEESSVGGDPIAFCRGLEPHGLKIFEVGALEIQALFDTARAAIAYVRTGKPAVLHCKNVGRKHGHTHSDDPSRYMTPEEVKRHVETNDPLPLLESYLLDNGVVDQELLDRLKTLAKMKVEYEGRKALDEGEGDPEDLYKYQYGRGFVYGRVDPRTGDLIPNSDIGAGVDNIFYVPRGEVNYLSEYETAGRRLSYGQLSTLALACAMARNEKIVYFGQDISDVTREKFRNLEAYIGAKLAERNDLGEQQKKEILQVARQIREAKASEVSPDAFAAFVAIAQGKGGVFKATHLLQYLFGSDRVFNSALREASIVGTATGMSLSGRVPIAEIQFLDFIGPAKQQLWRQLGTMSWRSIGQFHPGLVLMVHGMGSMNGKGGPAHSSAEVSELLKIPGVITIMPAHANEVGPLLTEAIRLAEEHGQPVLFLEAINLLQTDMGYDQGADAHIPIGTAEIIEPGENVLVLSWSNSVRVVLESLEQVKAEGGRPTVVNLRTLGTLTDWKTLGPLIQRHKKVLIVESEGGDCSAGAGLLAKIAKHFPHVLVDQISGRNIPVPMGRKKEAFVIPQVRDVVRKLHDMCFEFRDREREEQEEWAKYLLGLSDQRWPQA